MRGALCVGLGVWKEKELKLVDIKWTRGSQGGGRVVDREGTETPLYKAGAEMCGGWMDGWGCRGSWRQSL